MAIAYQVIILHDSGNTGPGDVIAAGQTDLTTDSKYNGSIMSIRTDSPNPALTYSDTNTDVTEWNGATFSNATKNYDVTTHYVVWDAINEVYIIKRLPGANIAIAFGSMNEDNGSGTNLAVTTSYTGWVSANEGEVDSNGLITFSGNATADRLLVSDSGEGTYLVAFSVCFTNSGGNLTTIAIHKNDVEQVAVKGAAVGDSSNVTAIASSGFITVAEGDYLDLRMKSTASNTLALFNISVAALKIQFS